MADLGEALVAVCGEVFEAPAVEGEDADGGGFPSGGVSRHCD